MTAAAAVRLPLGWSADVDDDGRPVAGPVARRVGDPLLVHRWVAAAGETAEATAHALVAELASSRDELLVLDVEPVTCRDAAPGVRLLTAWRDGERGLTAEHWLVEGSGKLHVLAAVMETGRYAVEGPRLRTSLATFRHDRERSFGTGHEAPVPVPTPPSRPVAGTVVIEVDVAEGRNQGFCLAVVEGPATVIQLPGEDEPRMLSRSLLPSWLAGLVGLGPRPRPPCPGLLVVDMDRFESLLAATDEGDAAVRDALGTRTLPPAWTAALAALPGKVTGRWNLVRRLVGPRGDVVESCEVTVVDANDAGLWMVGPADAGWLSAELAGEPRPGRPVTVSATSPTAVWELFTGACAAQPFRPEITL